MKAFKKFAAATILVLLAAATVSAQMGMHGGSPQFHGVWSPVVGRGAAYETQSSDGKKTSMEITVVGKETYEGKDGYWLEMSFENAERGGEMVMKHLMVVDGQQTRPVKMIMQMPGRPPMEMPVQQMMQRNSAQAADVRNDAQDIGSESVTVPAGTFACEHYRTKDGGDVWAAKDVSPWGMVKFQSKDTTMVLTKVITDAKDRITGTPQPFDPMSMGRRPN
jgi:hypothetical protein